MIVDGSLRTIALDSGAQAILDDLNELRGGAAGAAGLPPEFIEFLGSRSTHELEATHLHVSAGGHEYACRALVLKPSNGAPPMVAVYLKRELSVGDAVDQVAADYHLTDREREALIGLSMGLTSKELAVRMNISPNTVKAFLRLIMIKMGTSTRTGIVARVLDQRAEA